MRYLTAQCCKSIFKGFCNTVLPALENPQKLSFQSDEDFQERRREVENLMKKNADWIWDWSSRPENSPPK